MEQNRGKYDFKYIKRSFSKAETDNVYLSSKEIDYKLKNPYITKNADSLLNFF